MEIRIYTDGGSSGNPGPSAIGLVIFFNEKKIFSFGSRIGMATNNIAEYSALVTALEKITGLLKDNKNVSFSKIIVFSDSQLLVNQMGGLYKIKDLNIKKLVLRAKDLEQETNIPVFYKYVPREENKIADSLVRKELYS